MGCGGINPDSLVQLYSLYIQYGPGESVPSISGSIGKSSVVNGAATPTILASIAPGSPTQTISNLAGLNPAVAASYEPAEPVSTTYADPLPDSPTIKQPAPAENSGATTPTTVGIPTIKQSASTSRPCVHNSSTVQMPTATGTTASVPTVTTIVAAYMTPFWVSIAPFIQAGDQFESYTVSSTDYEVNDTSIWWDPPAVGFVGVGFPGPPSGSAKWFILVTMRPADGGAYYDFLIEIDVTGESTQATGGDSPVPAPSYAASSTRVAPSSLLPGLTTTAPPLVSSLPLGQETNTADDAGTTITVTVWTTVTSWYTVWQTSWTTETDYYTVLQRSPDGKPLVLPRGVAPKAAVVSEAGMSTTEAAMTRTSLSGTTDVGGQTSTVVSVKVVWSQVSGMVDMDGPLWIAAATDGTESVHRRQQ